MKVLNRAKALDGNKEYITSQSIKFEKNKMYLYSIPFKQWIECDKSTRSINFEDVSDSENNPIFASLSESGKGGDIMESEKFKNNMALNGVVKYDKGRISIDTSGFMPKFEKLKIIGIQK